MKLAYADRTAFLGDPTFTENMPIEGLSSKEYAKAQLARIGETANTSPAPGNPYDYENESQNTTHYSVIDKDGNMACMDAVHQLSLWLRHHGWRLRSL